ncbi:T-complex protein 1 subunit theta [Neocloeon triangulifer]|uniref:T-complex protein 1 subunit theta n=1 Tax=Neocloeon triangulifer TaxID=2078957 RepID=UPI00286ECCEF|nr:T-complex protein 1 subunit theta [Neocloeon triangulifer]
MALHVPKAPGVAQMLKEGSRLYSGLEEVVYRNISACKQLAHTLRTAYGPTGMNKMVINHLEKLFVTNDAATIIKELEVEHPAAKMLVLASQMQEQEIGDGTNFVIIFAGALLEAAEDLLRMGLTPTEVVEGYELALEKALEILPTLVCKEVKDLRDAKQVEEALKTAISSKQYGQEDFLTTLITKACVSVVPDKSTSFNVDNVRICKIAGCGLLSSEVVPGMVFKRFVEGTVSKKSQAKVALYTCPIDIMQTETSGTVLIKTAEELKSFSRGEETQLEDQIKGLKDAGADVVVAAGKFGDMALHYLNKYDMMAVRLTSKFDLRRLCKATNATALPRLIPPNKEELGYADLVSVDEVGDTGVVIFKIGEGESKISTVVIRGATDNYMDDIERCIDDGVNTYKGLTKDNRLVPGAGAVESELALLVNRFGEGRSGLEQYAIQRFAHALEALPKALAENSGVKGTELLAKLQSAHAQGQNTSGLDIESGSLLNSVESKIFDLFITKYWGLKYATSAACTVLKVDQIIMAKRAGGPKARAPGGQDQDDD